MPRKSKLQPENTEWSHFLRVDDIPDRGRQLTISPPQSAYDAIASRIGVVALKDFTATLDVGRSSSAHVVEINGAIKATVTQKCAITLEPIETVIDDKFDAFFADHAAAVPFERGKQELFTKNGIVELPMLDEKDDPEPIVDGKIDLGELATQYLSLAINPYACKEGAVLKEGGGQGKQEPVKSLKTEKLRPNPFEALRNWRPKD